MIDDRITQAEHEFLSALLAGGIQPICNAAYKIFQLPIVVVDDIGRCIYQYPTGYIEVEDRTNAKFLSAESSLKIQQAFATYKEPNLNVAYINDNEIRDSPCLMGFFYEGDTVAGYLGIFLGTHEPDSMDYQIADLFCRAMSSIYTSSIKSFPTNVFHRSYVLDILRGDISGNDCKHINWGSLSIPPFAVLVSPVSQQHTNSTVDRRVCDAITKKHKGVYSVIYDNNIVTVCCGLSEDTKQRMDSSNLIKDLLESFSSYNYTTGISKRFFRMLDLKAHYMQALFTVKIGMKLNFNKKSHFVEDYSPLQFFLPIAELPMPQTWFHPIVEEMRGYDEKHNTEYLTTIKEYVFSGKNRKNTAKQLNIHFNTLNYRLDKMEDLFNISQLTRQEYLGLLCSFLLTELI